MIKATQGGKDLFDLYFHIIVHLRKKSKQKLRQGRNIEAGTDTEGIGVLLTDLFLFITGLHKCDH